MLQEGAIRGFEQGEENEVSIHNFYLSPQIFMLYIYFTYVNGIHPTLSLNKIGMMIPVHCLGLKFMILFWIRNVYSLYDASSQRERVGGYFEKQN